jgi:hypothetical protein
VLLPRLSPIAAGVRIGSCQILDAQLEVGRRAVSSGGSRDLRSQHLVDILGVANGLRERDTRTMRSAVASRHDSVLGTVLGEGRS